MRNKKLSESAEGANWRISNKRNFKVLDQKWCSHNVKLQLLNLLIPHVMYTLTTFEL